MEDILLFIVFVGIYAFSAVANYKKKQKQMKEQKERQQAQRDAQANKSTGHSSDPPAQPKPQPGLLDVLKEMIEEEKNKSNPPISPKTAPVHTNSSYDDQYEDYEEDDYDEDYDYEEHSKGSSQSKPIPAWADGTYAEMSTSEYLQDDINEIKPVYDSEGSMNNPAALRADNKVSIPTSEELKQHLIWREILGPCKGSRKSAQINMR